MPDTDRIPDIRSNEWNIEFFRKTEGKNRDLYLDRFRSVPNPISRERIFHFQRKNMETYTSIFRNLLILLRISSMWFCFWAWETFLRRYGQLAKDVLPSPPPPRPPTPSLNYRTEPRPWEPPQTMWKIIETYTATFPAVQKKSVAFRSYTFFCVNDVTHMTCQRFMFRSKVFDRQFAHLW